MYWAKRPDTWAIWSGVSRGVAAMQSPILTNSHYSLTTSGHLVHPSGVPRSPPLRQEPAKLRSGGLVLPRRLTPLPRRNAVYFCSGAYIETQQTTEGWLWIRKVTL